MNILKKSSMEPKHIAPLLIKNSVSRRIQEELARGVYTGNFKLQWCTQRG